MKTKIILSNLILVLLIGSIFSAADRAYGGEPGTVKWHFWFDTANSNERSPAIADDGTVYAGTIGTFYAFNPDGSVKWSYYAFGDFKATPAIGNDGTVYVCNSDADTLFAFNPDGGVKWTSHGSLGLYGAPAIAHDGTIFIGSDFGLYAFSPDGDVFLDFPTSGAVRNPVIDMNGTVYFVSRSLDGSTLFAVNSFGWYQWSYELAEAYGGSLAIGNAGAILVSADKLYAFGPDGNLMWTFPTNNAVAHPIAPSIGSDGTVYVPSQDWFYAVNPDGTQKWRAITARARPPEALIGVDGTVYLTLMMNTIFAINPVGPYIRWYFGTKGEIHSSPAISSDGVLYFVEEFGVVALYTDSYGPDNSVWPMYRANNKRTARVDRYSISMGSIRHLLFALETSGLNKGTKNSLAVKLHAAIGALEDERPRPAINKMQAFVNEVDALSGKKLAVEKATYFVERASQIIDAINYAAEW